MDPGSFGGALASLIQLSQQIDKSVRHPLADHVVVHCAQVVTDPRLNLPTEPGLGLRLARGRRVLLQERIGLNSLSFLHFPHQPLSFRRHSTYTQCSTPDNAARSELFRRKRNEIRS